MLSLLSPIEGRPHDGFLTVYSSYESIALVNEQLDDTGAKI